MRASVNESQNLEPKQRLQRSTWRPAGGHGEYLATRLAPFPTLVLTFIFGVNI
jgi:hypothetical protein